MPFSYSFIYIPASPYAAFGKFEYENNFKTIDVRGKVPYLPGQDIQRGRGDDHEADQDRGSQLQGRRLPDCVRHRSGHCRGAGLPSGSYNL